MIGYVFLSNNGKRHKSHRLEYTTECSHQQCLIHNTFDCEEKHITIRVFHSREKADSYKKKLMLHEWELIKQEEETIFKEDQKFGDSCISKEDWMNRTKEWERILSMMFKIHDKATIIEYMNHLSVILEWDRLYYITELVAMPLYLDKS